MKWLIAFVLTAFIPTAEVAAQEAGTVTWDSVSSLAASSAAAQPQPAPQAIRAARARRTARWALR